jgi:hypothetical protein
LTIRNFELTQSSLVLRPWSLVNHQELRTGN